ncbi:MULTISPECIES: hypothetical protein [Flavobacteriaceae]|uniref:hypothetical protein n=1 Tax=Flavobacteriaceae TaxID=49546 RepID=UPI001492621A|nr:MULTISPECIES: hypothetical protein [Allomuricauda]MDC6366667.1 hypothetical protein [Muricauda sp. AC10]
MKKLIVLQFMFLMACGSNKHADFDSAQVNYVSNDKLESITVNSTDSGENQEEAIYNAKKLAFQNLFFRGISNSPFNKPLISINEQAAFKKHKTYLNAFYSKRMGTFITNSHESISKVRGGRRLAKVNMTINMLALRKDLEEHQVIKKFGL